MATAEQTVTPDPFRHMHEHEHLRGAFGSDVFGQRAERLARFFGTPQYIVGQTIVVILWIATNAVAVTLRWDPYPFILLNLAFSTQAAYAAPLILLAQTRQADRDKATEMASAKHRDELSGQQVKMADQQVQLIQENTELTQRVAELSEQIEKLTEAIHARVVAPKRD